MIATQFFLCLLQIVALKIMTKSMAVKLCVTRMPHKIPVKRLSIEPSPDNNYQICRSGVLPTVKYSVCILAAIIISKLFTKHGLLVILTPHSAVAATSIHFDSAACHLHNKWCFKIFSKSLVEVGLVRKYAKFFSRSSNFQGIWKWNYVDNLWKVFTTCPWRVNCQQTNISSTLRENQASGLP